MGDARVPKVLCVACGDVAEYIVRKDYDIKKGGVSVCSRCKPTKGVWAKRITDGDAKVALKPKVRRGDGNGGRAIKPKHRTVDRVDDRA